MSNENGRAKYLDHLPFNTRNGSRICVIGHKICIDAMRGQRQGQCIEYPAGFHLINTISIKLYTIDSPYDTDLSEVSTAFEEDVRMTTNQRLEQYPVLRVRSVLCIGKFHLDYTSPLSVKRT